MYVFLVNYCAIIEIREKLSNLWASSVFADGLAPLDARASAGIMANQVGPVLLRGWHFSGSYVVM